MIIKKRTISLRIQQLEALLRRLPMHFPKRPEIEGELARYKAGFRGEQTLDYYLSYLPEKEYFIFHDIRLSDGIHYFQMDTLLLSLKYLLIIEVKNFYGTLFFDHTFHQLIRTANGNEEAYPDPILQVKTQQNKLEKWLEINKFSNVPIESIVVISSPSTILKTSLNNKEALKRVTLSNNLLNKVKELEGAFKLDKSTPKELKKIANLLLKQHTPQITDILKQFQINKSDILTGVHCPQCYFISMKRISGAWYCPKCRISSKDAHLFSLNDFALLIDTSITNKKIREFLHLSSRSTASKLLTAMDLEQFGNKRGRVYHLSVL